MTKDEALDLALEALEIEDAACRYLKEQTPSQIVDAIAAIKQARSAPVQEPVAWMDASGDIYKHELWPDWNPPHTPLYTTPPAAPVQEPLFWYKPYPNGMYNGPVHNAQIGDVLRGSEEWRPLYTTPPAAQRQWVDMPELELLGAYEEEQRGRFGDHVRGLLNVQAKLKEKNT